MNSSILLSSNSHSDSDSNDCPQIQKNSRKVEFTDLHDQVITNLKKPNTPNVNVPERIIICLDICSDNNSSLFKLADGTTFTPINMMKRVLYVFIHTKLAINRRTQFAVMFLGTEATWKLDFTSNVKNIFSVIDLATAEENAEECCALNEVFQLLKEKVAVPEYKQGESILVPPYTVRLLLLYGRSHCVPVIPQDDPYFAFFKNEQYFITDIIYAHEDDHSSNKCGKIFDCLQILDNGYSYVYEVSRNAAKIHDCAAKMLAHPLQRVPQKHTDYRFGTRLS